MPFDLTTKTAAITLVIAFELIFMASAVITACFPQTHDLSADLWKSFLAANGALMLALNVNSNNQGPQPPLAPAGQ